MSEKDIQKVPFTHHSFQQFLNEGKLMASRCSVCQRTYLPVRGLCPKCGGSSLEWVEMAGTGKLAAYTSVFVGPSFMNAEGFGRDHPYLTGIVELDEGPRISARLTGMDAKKADQIASGTGLVFSTIEIGEGENSYSQLAFHPEG